MAASLLRATRAASLVAADGPSTSPRCCLPARVQPARAAILASRLRSDPDSTKGFVVAAAVNAAASPISEQTASNGRTSRPVLTVNDVMTTGVVHSVKVDDTIDDALQILVNYKVTGLPVVDENRVVVGVVSDFDLLALDSLGRTNDEELFPMADQTWQAFKEVKSMLAKTMGKKIFDVMTRSPIVVRPETCLEDATRLLLRRKIRRLPVVDADGRLVGVLSRGNIVKAALAQRLLEAPRCELPSH